MQKLIRFPHQDRDQSDPPTPDTNFLVPEQLELMRLLGRNREALANPASYLEALRLSLCGNDGDASPYPANAEIGG
ncbi:MULTISPECIES: hypothetical protein [Rhizobium]|uniref:Uncharacterized protein n=1 Tax=Rhizobium paranaense TaxID=1650438 RepID=A0A7W9D455_9HYPH|nr:hypothetical protein [Rhizobium paranaense]MBB5576591.1 hypothetical protein [Rhizobium paranaense]